MIAGGCSSFRRIQRGVKFGRILHGQR
jgi:hypothetical protein